MADTNILISAVMFGGLPGAVLDLALLRAFELLTSPVLLDELVETLREKFKVVPDDAAAIRARLESGAFLVEPRIALAVIVEDPDDDRVLECAVEGQAHCIVSATLASVGRTKKSISSVALTMP